MQEKQYWRQYIYLWINYAFYEELDAEDINRCRVLLLEIWRDFKNEKGDEESRTKIIAKMTRRIKRRRRIVGEDKVYRLILNNFWRNLN